MSSIKTRLILSSLLVLVAFMLLTAWGLEQAVSKRMLEAEKSRMEALMYSILAAVDRDASGLSITVADERLFEGALFDPLSGLYAQLFSVDEKGRLHEIWRSLSMSDSFPPPQGLRPEEMRFQQVEYEGDSWFQLAFSIRWPNVHAELDLYTVTLWKDASDYLDQFRRFRQTLWLWLAATIVMLLLVMWGVMVWSLKPLRQIGEEVQAIEEGRQQRFEARYPAEIQPLTQNLNALLKREQHQMDRYRHALDDLAHSLKTPLAVLRGLSEKSACDGEDLQTLAEQSERMNQIVSYQLQRAATLGGAAMAKPLELMPLLSKTVSALRKVYGPKGMQIEVVGEAARPLRLDESDLLELLGNLIDNACKYGRRQVRIEVRQSDSEIELIIDDDGKGLDADQRELILQRGSRLDQSQEGQGIGLAVVQDIVEAYELRLEFEESPLGGLRVRLIFPAD